MRSLNSSGAGERDFFVSMVMLILCLILFAMSLYLLPFLLWNLHYNVPEFVFVWQEELKQTYNYTYPGAGIVIFFVFFIPSLLCGYLSKQFATSVTEESADIASEAIRSQDELDRIAQKRRETWEFTLKLFSMAVLVFVVVYLIEWLITGPPPV